jgi:hypothetical protein
MTHWPWLTIWTAVGALATAGVGGSILKVFKRKKGLDSPQVFAIMVAAIQRTIEQSQERFADSMKTDRPESQIARSHIVDTLKDLQIHLLSVASESVNKSVHTK